MAGRCPAPVWLLAACGREAPEAPRAQAPVVRGVRVATATLETVSDGLEAVGTVRSKTQTLISSKVQGYVRAGERARRGQVEQGPAARGRRRSGSSSCGVDRAQAALEEARMARDEAGRLHERGRGRVPLRPKPTTRYAEATENAVSPASSTAS